MNKPRLLFLRSAIQLLHFTLKPGQRWLGFVKGHERTSSRWQISCLDPFKAHTCYKGKEDMSDVFVTWQSKAPPPALASAQGSPWALALWEACPSRGASVEARNPPCAVSIQVPTKGCSRAEKKKVPNHATGGEGSWVSRLLAWARALSPCYLMCQYSPHGVQPELPQCPHPAWRQQLTKCKGALGS